MTQDEYRYDSSIANYDPTLGNVSNLVGFGITLEPASKAPVIANRIFSTFDAMVSYVEDENGTCIAGLTLAVVNDPDEEKNGSYYVKTASGGGLEVEKGSEGVNYDTSIGLRINEVEDSTLGVVTKYISVNEGVGIFTDSSNNISIQINNNVLNPSGHADDASCNVQFFEKKNSSGVKNGMAGRMVWSIWESN